LVELLFSKVATNAEELLKHRNKQDLTPLQFAINQKNDKLSKLLEQFMNIFDKSKNVADDLLQSEVASQAKR